MSGKNVNNDMRVAGVIKRVDQLEKGVPAPTVVTLAASYATVAELLVALKASPYFN